MNEVSIPRRAFIELRGGTTNLNLPPQYLSALDLSSDGYMFYLHWPVELFPHRKEKFYLGFRPFYGRGGGLPVRNVMYMHGKEGIDAYAEVTVEGEVDIQSLLFLSEMGFLTERRDLKSIAQVFREAGLATTLDEYFKK